MPLQLQNSSHFETLRTYLRNVGFSAKSICAILGIAELRDLLVEPRRDEPPPKGADELSVIVRLLLLGESFTREELQSTLSSLVVETLTSLGLATGDNSGEISLSCSVAVYPVGRLFIVSDRWFAVDGKDFKPPDDVVYPAITPNTTEFLATLPATACDSFLELCSGTGAVALAASAYAKRSWAIDITERSAQMAEFNRLLNGIENTTVLKGDLYEGVEGLKFDRIVAHPPYMPVLRPAQIFYDGGADGEHLTRRIVEALPRFLKPGGCFYCLAQGSDRKDALLEARVRHWLDDAHSDFDVAIVEKRKQDPKEAAFIYALKSQGGAEAVDRMRRSLASLGVESMVYGWMIIQRRNDPRRPFTVRRSAGGRTGAGAISWLLRWETFAAGTSSLDRLLEMVPLPRRLLELQTIHRMKEGELLPAHLTLHAEDPFAMDCPVDPWVAMLIPMCNGKATVRQLWETCKGNNFIHADTPPHDFAQFIGVLISGGFLEVAGYCPPSADDIAENAGVSARDPIQPQTL